MFSGKLKKAALCAVVLCAVSTSSVFASDKDVYQTYDGDNIAAKVLYEYKPDSLFTFHTCPGYLTDIELKKGETVNYIGAGDTARWIIDQADVNGIHHVYIKPKRANIRTNLIINTDEHSYRFMIESTESEFTPIVQFKFTDEEKAAMDAAYHRRLLQPKPLTPEEKEYRDIFCVKQGNIYVRKVLNTHYIVKRHGRIPDEVYPTRIFDDGHKTYFEMPEANKYDLPTLYNVAEGNKLTLVNYRIKGHYYIVDKVMEHSRLQFSSTSYLDVTFKDARLNHLLPSKVDYSDMGQNDLHDKLANMIAERQQEQKDAMENKEVEASLEEPDVTTPSGKALSRLKNSRSSVEPDDVMTPVGRALAHLDDRKGSSHDVSSDDTVSSDPLFISNR